VQKNSSGTRGQVPTVVLPPLICVIREICGFISFPGEKRRLRDCPADGRDLWRNTDRGSQFFDLVH